MVLTDLPFARPNLLQGRYALLERPGSAGGSEEEEEEATGKSQEYAAFLREKERKCGSDGFLDSHRYKYSFSVKKEKKEAKDRDDKSKSLTVVDLMAKKERDQKEYDRRMKVIEDHMWQHKQEERELKRVEGDVIKNQRIVRRTLRDYENAITRKRLAEEKKLNQGLEKYTVLQRQHVHKKEDLMKQRTEKNVVSEQLHRDTGRKVQLTTSDLARKYRSKMSEMELKRVEAMRLSQDYQTKLKKKEEEQYKLKQELAELAIALNMEAQKGRQQEHEHHRSQKKDSVQKIQDDHNHEATLTNKLARSDGDTKGAEINRRKLSADLTLTRSHLQLKQREDKRHLLDTRNRLTGNINEQKQLNEAALHAELDDQARAIDQKVQAHDSRKRVQLLDASRQKKEKGEDQEATYSSKFKTRYADQMRREHEDHLKHFQKTVVRGEERELNLYNKVRNTEYTRQKQEQKVRRLHNKLMEAKRQNAIKMKNEMTDLTRQEQELEQKFLREKAELAKVHAQREESYLDLQHHRVKLREDKYLLGEHEREHGRLVAVGSRSMPMTESY